MVRQATKNPCTLSGIYLLHFCHRYSHTITLFTYSNRSDCEDLCLNNTDLPCRSASFDATSSRCSLSKETRHMNPYAFREDPAADYMENMCLKRESRSRVCLSQSSESLLIRASLRQQDVHFGSLHPRNEPRTGRQLRAGQLLLVPCVFPFLVDND